MIEGDVLLEDHDQMLDRRRGVAIRTIVGDGRGDRQRQAAAYDDAMLHFLLPRLGWKKLTREKREEPLRCATSRRTYRGNITAM